MISPALTYCIKEALENNKTGLFSLKNSRTEFLTIVNDEGCHRAQRAFLRYHSYNVSNVITFKRKHMLLLFPFRRQVVILHRSKVLKFYDNDVSSILTLKARFTSPDINLQEMEPPEGTSA